MKIKKLKNSKQKIVEGPLEIIPDIFKDERGYFLETWNKSNFDIYVNSGISFVQDNQSLSRKGTIRGLHYQLNPMPQGKLVRVTKGKVFDVIIDLRQNSKTFSSWISLILNCEDKNQIWIPEGFAHGFLTLSEEAIVEYKVTNLWKKELDRTILWNDPTISIDWPLTDDIYEPNLSQRDTNGLTLEAAVKKGEIF